MAAIQPVGLGEVDLESLGLPIANEENKKLEAEVQRKEREITSLQLQIEEHRDRIQAISDHLRNVRQEVQHTQVCLRAGSRENDCSELASCSA